MLAGKNIVVTGAAGGAGSGIVRHLLDQGANVVATDIVDEKGDELVRTTNSIDRLAYVHMDVSHREEVFAVIDDAAARLGKLDGLVNTAGILHAGKPEEATMEQIDMVFATHFKGTVNTNQAIFPHLCSAGGGAIVNFGSLGGIRGMPTYSIYNAAKGAVFAWTRNLAMEWGQHNIRANAMAPVIRSSMTDAHSVAHATTENSQDSGMAIRRLGDSERDLAPMIALLLSDGGTYITGQAISVDGGIMMLGS